MKPLHGLSAETASDYDFDDVRGFIDRIDRLGQLRRMSGAHWDLEMGGITEFYAERRGPAVLFEAIPDYPGDYRWLTNCFASYERTAMALRLPVGLSGLPLLAAWREKLHQAGRTPPCDVTSAEFLAQRFMNDDVNLLSLPVPRWHAGDGGRYLGTANAVITRDPDDGWVNLGTYRGMVHDRNHIGVKANKGKHGRIHIDKWHARGEPCPIAMAFGFDPSLWVGASSTFTPWGVSEYEFAGWLRGRPIEVLPGPLTGLPLPASAEVVLEGHVPLPNGEGGFGYREGPFGEWMGYYADTTDGVVPAMAVDALYMRHEPVLVGAPPLRPPAPYFFAIPLVAAAVWDELERAGVPDVKGVWIHASNWGPLFLVVAIHQHYAGHSRQAGLAASGCRSGAYGGRFAVIVDDDVDITNLDEVVWAMCTRCRVEKDIDIVHQLWQTPADPLLTQTEREQEETVASHAIIDACRPYGHLRNFPRVNAAPRSYLQELAAKWGL